jgi:hypothetical protein
MLDGGTRGLSAPAGTSSCRRRRRRTTGCWRSERETHLIHLTHFGVCFSVVTPVGFQWVNGSIRSGTACDRSRSSTLSALTLSRGPRCSRALGLEGATLLAYPAQQVRMTEPASKLRATTLCPEASVSPLAQSGSRVRAADLLP